MAAEPINTMARNKNDPMDYMPRAGTQFDRADIDPGDPAAGGMWLKGNTLAHRPYQPSGGVINTPLFKPRGPGGVTVGGGGPQVQINPRPPVAPRNPLIAAALANARGEVALGYGGAPAAGRYGPPASAFNWNGMLPAPSGYRPSPSLTPYAPRPAAQPVRGNDGSTWDPRTMTLTGTPVNDRPAPYQTKWGLSTPNNFALGPEIPPYENWKYGGHDAPAGAITGGVDGQQVRSAGPRVSFNPNGTVFGGTPGPTGTAYGTNPKTGNTVMNASPAGNYNGGGFVGSSGGTTSFGSPTFSGGSYGIGGLFGMPGGRIEQFILNRKQ